MRSRRRSKLASMKHKASYLEYATCREYGLKRQFMRSGPASLSHRFPFIWDGRSLPINYSDKIFASQWISNEEILFGTKCNHFGVLNCKTSKMYDIPLIEETDKCDFQEQSCGCGIHTIQKNPSQTYVATGGKSVTTIGVYSLPDLTPTCIFQKQHKNCIFDSRWIDDAHLVSCSRDSCLALWRLPCAEVSDLYHYPNSSITNPCPIPEYASVDTPVGYTISKTPNDRFRALEYLPTRNILTVVSMSDHFYLYDINHLFSSSSGYQKPLCKITLLSYDKEAVALRRWPNNPHVVSIATHRSVLLFDIRCRSRVLRTAPRSIDSSSAYSSCVRSLNFSGDLLSYGTSAGKVHFYDLVAGKHLSNHLDIETKSRKPNPIPLGHQSRSSVAFGDSLPDLAASLTRDVSPSPPESDHWIELDDEDLAEESLLTFIQSAAFRPESNRRALIHIGSAAASLRRRIRDTSIRLSGEGTADEPNNAVQTSEDDEVNNVDLLNEVYATTTNVLHMPPLFVSPEIQDDLDNFVWAGLRGYPALGTNIAVYTHEYDPSGTRLFTAGGPIGSAFSGNFAVVWD